MKIRVLNSEGIAEFRNQLYELKSGIRKDFNSFFLTHSKYSSEFSKDIDIDFMRFKDKHEITKYICEKLDLINNKSLYYDKSLWTWLTCFYFDLMCPSNSSGLRSIKAEARYILTDPKIWTRYYRHLLACYARVFCELGELSEPFLSSPIHIWGDFHEQLSAYQGIATNKPLIQTANSLYWDSEDKKLKKGSGSKGAGTPRRFSDIIGQFELTFDLNAMPSVEILNLLPEREFKKWIVPAA